MIATLPNNTSGMRLFMAHTLAIPPCCPVSRNPLAGSTFTICYRARVDVLEVYSLKAYIRDFVGGYRGVTGEIEIRTMEGMIARVVCGLCVRRWCACARQSRGAPTPPAIHDRDSALLSRT